MFWVEEHLNCHEDTDSDHIQRKASSLATGWFYLFCHLGCLAVLQFPLECEGRTVVANAIKHFAGERYDLTAYVVMDDQVHVIVAPKEGVSLQAIVHTWKSFTANRLQRDFGRIGGTWQDEYFD
jgi:hypothetical protein